MALTLAPDRRRARRQALLGSLGHPERAFPVVHVAGTNGKGSTVAMVAEGLRAAGYKVGRFTSPDLAGPHERFWYDGASLTPSALASLERELAATIEATEAAFPDLPSLGAFERWCALAWCWFRGLAIDVAVVEVGVGGRSDATNVFERTVVTLVSAIARDHADRLGHDLAGIAREKAGIFRPGVPALTSADPAAATVLAAVATDLGAPFVRVPPLIADGSAALLPEHAGGGRVRLALGGEFQRANAALAVAGLLALREAGWHIPDEAIVQALEGVSWPGRLECLPDPSGGEWLLDGAHNPAAVEALTDAWEGPEVVVAGVQAGKDAPAIIAALTAGGRPLVAVDVPGAEQAWPAASLAAWAAGPVEVARDLDDAFALARARSPRGRRCITGSLYLVGAARTRLLGS